MGILQLGPIASLQLGIFAHLGHGAQDYRNSGASVKDKEQGLGK